MSFQNELLNSGQFFLRGVNNCKKGKMAANVPPLPTQSSCLSAHSQQACTIAAIHSEFPKAQLRYRLEILHATVTLTSIWAAVYFNLIFY